MALRYLAVLYAHGLPFITMISLVSKASEPDHNAFWLSRDCRLSGGSIEPGIAASSNFSKYRMPRCVVSTGSISFRNALEFTASRRSYCVIVTEMVHEVDL